MDNIKFSVVETNDDIILSAEGSNNSRSTISIVEAINLLEISTINEYLIKIENKIISKFSEIVYSDSMVEQYNYLVPMMHKRDYVRNFLKEKGELHG